ncbi:hypothetical protein E2C01_032939 [Portunus trituberculatus]|uniref:Uncharacterized protein n=1 Tax=Portunus trituberculatus TaxID=210409 RepID=A0A5B7F4B1_PORTR|nr:hypothetical protein [Portunus trituberculatus]
MLDGAPDRPNSLDSLTWKQYPGHQHHRRHYHHHHHLHSRPAVCTLLPAKPPHQDRYLLTETQQDNNVWVFIFYSLNLCNQINRIVLACPSYKFCRETNVPFLKNSYSFTSFSRNHKK